MAKSNQLYAPIAHAEPDDEPAHVCQPSPRAEKGLDLHRTCWTLGLHYSLLLIDGIGILLSQHCLRPVNPVTNPSAADGEAAPESAMPFVEDSEPTRPSLSCR